MKRSFFGRHGLTIIILVGLLFPVTVYGAIMALRSNRNDVEEWLPDSFPETRDYQWFRQHFTNETFVLVSWTGCTLDDPRLAVFDKYLCTRSPLRSYYTDVVTGQELIDDLLAPPIRLTRTQAIARLQRSLIGHDGQHTCAVVTLSDAAQQDLHVALDEIYRAAVQECHIPRSSVRMGGPPVDNVAIDLEGERMLVKLVILCAGVGVALAAWYLRNLRLTAMVFVGGAYSAALSLAVVYFAGGTMNSILLTMPSVVYTSGLAASIHLVNYYRHTRARTGLPGSPGRGLKLAWAPCMLSAGTTSLGLISLYTSELVPIKNFGLYTALGVMAAVGLIFLFLPAALQLWPPALAESRLTDHEHVSLLSAGHRRRMRRISAIVIARPWLVWTIFMVAMVVGGAGLHRAKTTVNLMSLFSPNAEIIHSYRWLEDNLGPLVPMEVVVRIDPQSNLSLLQRFQLIQQIQRSVESIDAVGSTMSAATFGPALAPPRSGGLGGIWMGQSTWAKLLNRRLSANLDRFLHRGYLAHDKRTGEELWRINVRVAALQDIDYGLFINNIKQQVDPVLESSRKQGAQGLGTVTYTGLTPVVYRAERVLLQGLIESFGWAFAMIAAVMSVVFRDIRAGLYTMLPNVWPVAVVFGLMSWLGIALDIGTMMTASVAMGVCVDDTVHFATWFRRGSQQGQKRREAVGFAYENSAGAIYQSTVIVAFGLVTFALSDFIPTQRFGYLMCTLLMFGLVSDLVLTPAMLAGPVGRFFTPKRGMPDSILDMDRRERGRAVAADKFESAHHVDPATRPRHGPA